MAVKLLDYFAPWCGPCHVMAPVLEEIEKELVGKVEVVRINVDKQPAEAQKYGVLSIPTYIIEKDGQEVGRKIGVTPKAELIKLLGV
ncbi:MAG: thioredoxin 1 [Microgenomates group bacterium Gr01-1014_7]|nr:MAG: thioredoxin 1 [Microgenomates group bacterium Gr01-1014_7]